MARTRMRKPEPDNYQALVTRSLGVSRGPVHFIDPGITGTGHATWIELPEARATRPDDCGCIQGIKKNDPWEERAYYVSTTLAENVFDEYGSSTVVVEWPELWSGSKKSQTSAERGDLLKLSYLVGQIGYVCRECGIRCVLVTPQQWKGSMSKAVVIARIERALGGWSPTSHDADATGMGLAAIGVL